MPPAKNTFLRRCRLCERYVVHKDNKNLFREHVREEHPEAFEKFKKRDPDRFFDELCLPDKPKDTRTYSQTINKVFATLLIGVIVLLFVSIVADVLTMLFS